MIYVYTGSVGSGKTYHAVAKAFEKMSYRRKNKVVANFGLKFTGRQLKKGYNDRFFYITDEELETPEALIRLSFVNDWVGKEGMALLILDEAAVYFNARDWQAKAKTRMDWIKFIVNSRKFGYDIIFITQDIKMLDRQMRSIIEFNVKHAKLNNYFWFKWLPLPLFVASQKWLAGDFRGQVSFRFLKPWVANKYDTMKLFDPQLLAEYAEYMTAAADGGTDGGVGVPSAETPSELPHNIDSSGQTKRPKIYQNRIKNIRKALQESKIWNILGKGKALQKPKEVYSDDDNSDDEAERAWREKAGLWKT